MIPGFVTPSATARYARRYPGLLEAGHFRQQRHVPGLGEVELPSIGLGTYLGEPDATADQGYEAAIAAGLAGGINLLDCAINYRHQRSERNIGRVIERMVRSGDLRRDEVVVCTKAGYLSFDGSIPPDP